MATETQQITPVQEWKTSVSSVLTLPSGKTCKARRVGLEALIKGGKIPNNLLPMMQGAMKGKSATPEELKAKIEEGSVLEMLELFDIVTIDTFLEPKVHPIPTDGNPRDEELLYVDEIDMEDKQFVFQWAVGGTSDVEKFREQANQFMDALQPKSSVGNTPKRPSRSK